MRVIKRTKPKPNGGTIRRLVAAPRPEGNLLAVVVGTESACHSVRWLNLADGSEILRNDLSASEGVPVPALSANLRELAYFERDGDTPRLFLERAEKGDGCRPIKVDEIDLRRQLLRCRPTMVGRDRLACGCDKLRLGPCSNHRCSGICFANLTAVRQRVC